MSKHTLLLIEDNPLLIRMYKTAFEERGVHVFLANSGQEGIELARKKKPEVIVLDLFMHGVDGFDVLRELGKDKEMKNVKKIILTAVSANSAQEKAHKLGADDYIIKSETELKSIVERVSTYFSK